MDVFSCQFVISQVSKVYTYWDVLLAFIGLMAAIFRAKEVGFSIASVSIIFFHYYHKGYFRYCVYGIQF